MTKQKCIDSIKSIQIGYLATADETGQPYLRPVDMGTVLNEKIYFSTFNSTNKVKQISVNSKIEALFVTKNMEQYRVKGSAYINKDLIIEKEFLSVNPTIKKMFEGKNKEKFMLYVIDVDEFNYMGVEDNTYKKVNWKVI